MKSIGCRERERERERERGGASINYMKHTDIKQTVKRYTILTRQSRNLFITARVSNLFETFG